MAVSLMALTACTSPTGSRATDRDAAKMVRKLSIPRQSSADGLVRTFVFEARNLQGAAVLEAQALDAATIDDPLARLVMRFHDPGSTGFSSTPPVTACYEARFNYYGVMGDPDRVNCPAGARPLVPVPLPTQAQVVMPADFDRTLAAVLTSLPGHPQLADVRQRVLTQLPALTIDPTTGLRNLNPDVQVALRGDDVGVSVSGAGCLLGARTRGEPSVWRLSRVQQQPGELSCDPQTALNRQGIAAPH